MPFAPRMHLRRIFWLTTLAFVVPQAGFTWLYWQRDERVVEAFSALGYPLYLIGLLAVVKTVALLLVVSPAPRGIQEWIYAGLSCEALGAAASHFVRADSAWLVVAPLSFFCVQLASYFSWKTLTRSESSRAGALSEALSRLLRLSGRGPTFHREMTGTFVAKHLDMSRSHNQLRILYWALTLLFVVPQTWAAVQYIIEAPRMTETIVALGYPVYFMKILAVFKIAGVLAIVTGVFPTLKEWAYAGFTFDVIGAFLSHVSAGDSWLVAAVPLAVMAIQLGSYFVWKQMAVPHPVVSRRPGFATAH